MPPELEWFANLDNPRTRRAYRIDVKEFTAFAGVEHPEEMRQITRAHLIAWRKDLERRGLAPSSIRRKLAAVASLCKTARACPTCASSAKAPKSATCRPIRSPCNGFTITWKPPVTQTNPMGRCFGPSKTRQGRGAPTGRSPTGPSTTAC
jgi:hypothetical protein